MNSFSLDQTLFRVSASDRDLPFNIHVKSDGIGIVLGNDAARVMNLTFRLNCLRPCIGQWHGNTLRELAWESDPRVLLSTCDYARLMSQARRDLSSDLNSVRGDRRLLPKTERFIEHRFRPVETPDWIAGPGSRVITRTDNLLRDLNCASIDDIVSEMESPELSKYKRDYFYERSTVVAIVSGMITDAEQRLLATYLKKAESFTPHVNIVLVVDDPETWKRIRQNPEWADWANMQPAPLDRRVEGKSDRYKLGFVSWPADTLDGQVKHVVNLVKQVICDGGEFSDVTVNAGRYSTNLVVRQELLDAGLPIHNSESYLLPMRPPLLTLMSILALANGIGRVQGLSRMIEIWPRLDWYDFETTLCFFWRLNDWPENFEKPVDNRVADFLDTLKPINQMGGGGNVHTWVDAALCAFNRLPTPDRHEKIREDAAAVCEWGHWFKTLDEFLCEFWRLRAVYGDWQGYRPSSGVSVSSDAERLTNKIVVQLHDASVKYEYEIPSKDVYFAPVSNSTVFGSKNSERNGRASLSCIACYTLTTATLLE